MSHHLPRGFRYAGVSGGIKSKKDAKDISLIVCDAPSVAAGVYTQNKVVAAPVINCRGKTPMHDARAVVVNSGNANACTGHRGATDAKRMCELVAEICDDGFSHEQTLVMSTGIIGRHLPMEKIERGIRQAVDELSDKQEAFLNAADGILTTDVGRKVVSRQLRCGGQEISLVGMAKGAGMIGPNMATMLCCLFTDAKLEPQQAQRLLQNTANQSFNNISVEGHTSTNDTMLLLASGKVGDEAVSGEDELAFAEQLTELSIELAKMIPTDGEGATHLIEITVRGAVDASDAREIAGTIAASNLVKTAVHGNDPNWGRIVSAAGYAQANVQAEHIQLTVNGFKLFEAGEPIPFNAKEVSQSMRDNRTTKIELLVGSGAGESTHWTSDLTVDYVRFNSEYTT